MMKQVTKSVYTIDSHPDKKAVYEWINNNWHDLNQHSVDELIESLKVMATEMQCKVHYSISQVPDSAGFIKFSSGDYCSEHVFISEGDIKTLKEKSENCKFTGFCHDFLLAECLTALSDLEEVSLKDLSEEMTRKALDSIHRETEDQYSDTALFEFCESNEYYFNEDGSFHY